MQAQYEQGVIRSATAVEGTIERPYDVNSDVNADDTSAVGEFMHHISESSPAHQREANRLHKMQHAFR